MSDAIPHPSHRSADSCSAGGLGECWSHPSGPTLSVDVRKPFRTTFRTSVTPTWPRSGRSLVVNPAWLWEVEALALKCLRTRGRVDLLTFVRLGGGFSQ